MYLLHTPHTGGSQPRFMQRIARHPVLHGDPLLRSFLESTDKVPLLIIWFSARHVAVSLALVALDGVLAAAVATAVATARADQHADPQDREQHAVISDFKAGQLH